MSSPKHRKNSAISDWHFYLRHILSSNTFSGDTGKAFGTNWNAFVFSLSMPISAWIAVEIFYPVLPQHRRGSLPIPILKNVSVHRHDRVADVLLTQLARMGSIFLGMALGPADTGSSVLQRPQHVVGLDNRVLPGHLGGHEQYRGGRPPRCHSGGTPAPAGAPARPRPAGGPRPAPGTPGAQPGRSST